MHRIALWFAICAGSLHAGVVGGAVLDFGSGRPLARSMVTIEPVPGGKAGLKTQRMRAGRAGQFSFHGVPPGLYRVYAQRPGFLTTFHGQRRPGGQGAPVEVTADSDLFTELRLHRMGAITGAVLDENGIGIAGASVLACRARLPLRAAARGTTDDRGIYRIGGLESGKYWVRTAAHTLEDGSGRLPTFGPQAQAIRDARVHEVRFDSEAIGADIHPESGTLYRLEGGVTCDPPAPEPARVRVTLTSETLRQTRETVCGGGYSFEGLAPGEYEISAVYAHRAGGAFAEFVLGGNLLMPLQLLPPVTLRFDAKDVTVVARHSDLAGGGEFRELPTPRAEIAPGYWDFNAAGPSGAYIAAIEGGHRGRRRSWRAERPTESFELYFLPAMSAPVRIVAGKAAVISGTAKRASTPAPGAPVFIWPVTETTRRQAGGWRSVITNVDGSFRIENLPPGDYRVLATFDASEATAELMEEAQAPTIRLESGQSASLDLPLWVAP